MALQPEGGTQEFYTYTGRLCLELEIQTFNLSYTFFDRKGTPFIYLRWKVVPLSHIQRRVFHFNDLLNCLNESDSSVILFGIF